MIWTDKETAFQFSWFRELVLPTFFVILGAALGFVLSQLNDWRKAKQSKKAFLRAIGMELDALASQLVEWNRMATESFQRVDGGGSTGPQIAAVLQTTVFTSQLGKLRNIDDPLLLEVVRFYSELGLLEQATKSVNETSAKFTLSPETDWLKTYDMNGPKPGTKAGTRILLKSSLRTWQELISNTAAKLKDLRTKLPSGELEG